MAHDTSQTPDPAQHQDLLTRILDFPVVGLGASAGGLRAGDAPFAQARKLLESFDARIYKPVNFDVQRKTGADLARRAAQPPDPGTDPMAGADAAVAA